ncbi:MULTISPECIES: thioester reductase domain-containing protein [unclassified Streptomyces]|uniref:thioester reductase domain-containing protein n=1 Tax=unclassified Streptomyces TaxID=2593676 RepID=UPI0006919259|nr:MULTISPECIES: thioester reductase domain-containing protein [unclassified Streptomyces]
MSSDFDIAVVGVGCRFPDARTPEEFWRNIGEGKVSTRPLDPDALRSAGVPQEVLDDPDYVPVAATLPGAQEFAAEFFGYSPSEAESIDPPQRLFLEACWEALEAAGHAPGTHGELLTGVFGGTAQSVYLSALQTARAQQHGVAAASDDMELHLGGLGDFLTSRVAYKLGLRGPSVGVQTACSSSLTAVHYASLSLLSGDCDIALAGGATVNEPAFGYQYQAGGLMSQDGQCRAFDAQSTGTSFSSGVGVVVLRRLSDALADGDPVLAVIRGSAVGNDGSDRSGFTAPSPAGLAGVVSTALRTAGVTPDQIRYVEAHGSGTALGDQIELRGLTDGFRAAAAPGATEETGWAGLGSVKVNIGHCGPAAGIAGFIKAVNIARTGELPPHPLFERPRNPGVLAGSPFTIDSAPGKAVDEDRHVLVNSMGLGGTNASVVLAAPPAPQRPSAPHGEKVVLTLSAQTRGELDELSRQLADALDAGGLDPADVAHTLRVGRRSFEERRVVTAAPGQLAAALRLPRPPAVRTVKAVSRRPVLVLPEDGQAPQPLLDLLTAALGQRVQTVRGPLGPVPAGRYALQLGAGESGPDRLTIALDDAEGPLTERVERALAEAWLGGVDIHWQALAGDHGRRLALPTYPFRRRRYWALDRIAPLGAPVEAAPACASAATVSAAAADGTQGPLPEDPVEADLVTLWRELFGIGTIGVDDEFGALGGTSLLSVRMALEVQQRHGILVNMHRAGGSRATVRRLAEIVSGFKSGAERGSADFDPIADGDGELVDTDLELSLGEASATETEGQDTLLTGATGFLGVFLLHQFLAATTGLVYCVVRAENEAQAWHRLREKSAEYSLPAPDPERVRIVLGDLTDIGQLCESYGDGELSTKIGRVVHCAAKVVFTEPYRVLRTDNVMPVVELVRWMNRHGIRDFSFISTVAATGTALEGGVLETREQPLDPQQGGYGVSKWVAERLLERAEQETGLRVRVFRPGFILGSTATGACNTKDLIWHILTSGLAVGSHPTDDRALPMAPVDIVSRAVAELSVTPSSAGNAYHLVDEVAVSTRGLFELLGHAGWGTPAAVPADWQRAVADRALHEQDEILSSVALYELEGHALGERDLIALNWRPWLESRGIDPAPTGRLVRSSLTYLAGQEPKFAALLGDLLQAPATTDTTEENHR